MSLDKLTKIDGGGISTTSDYRVGVITATKFVGPVEGSITATDASFSGNVSIAGTLTYEDVTNIDSVGIITAKYGIHLEDYIFHKGDTDTSIGFPSADTLFVKTAGVERLRIKSTGQVGIGTDNPLQKLHIADSTSANIYIETKKSDTGSTAGLYYKTSSSAASDFFKTGIVLEDDGTSYARGKLHILQNNTADGSNATLSDSVVTFTQDGKVGIGTNNPLSLLHVDGDVTIKDASPSILFSDDSGVPQNPDYKIQVNTGNFVINDDTNLSLIHI